MRQGWNRRWPTIDAPETVFLECVFQVRTGKMVIVDNDPDAAEKRNLRKAYAEFLDLPLDIYPVWPYV